MQKVLLNIISMINITMEIPIKFLNLPSCAFGHITVYDNTHSKM